MVNYNVILKKPENLSLMARPRLKDKYLGEIIPALKEKFQYKSVMEVPKLLKITVNKGIGAAVADKKLVDVGVEELTMITGQKAVATKAKNSISNFKLREEMPIGAMVTLRGDKMYEFLDRLVNIALPRIKDFRGLSANGFDKFGNYTFGIKEHIIFPEVSFDRADKVRGLDIIIVIKAINKEHSFALLEKMNFPFIKKGDN